MAATQQTGQLTKLSSWSSMRGSGDIPLKKLIKALLAISLGTIIECKRACQCDDWARHQSVLKMQRVNFQQPPGQHDLHVCSGRRWHVLTDREVNHV